jgi:hypothetical protein
LWTPQDPPTGQAAAVAYKAAHPQAFVSNPGGPIQKTCVRVGSALINSPLLLGGWCLLRLEAGA